MAKFEQDVFREKVREILRGYKQEYKKISEPLINKILRRINQGESVYNAVTTVLAETSFFNANSKAITDAIFLAACAGYGVSPSIMTVTATETIKNRLLSESWTGDKMKLSKRLHGSSKIMRQNIIDTISSAMRKGLMLRELAMKLYNGYNSKQGVLNKAEIPKYLEELRRSALMVANGDINMLKDFQKAIANAETNIKTLNSKNLKATYNELLNAAKKLNEKAINRSVRSVIEEKTRYHAERIARTETVRAWFDGFIAENQEDNEVFGYRWVLSSRHKLVPFDQCDVCANMNLGYGKGIYPKNKVPSIPRHPHCMCMLEVVYTWEIDVNAPLNPDGAREYIDNLNEQRKNSLFGIKGAKAYQQGDDWQKLLRGWDGFGEPKSRLDKKDFSLNLSNNDDRIKAIDTAEKIRKEVLEKGPVWKETKLEKHLKTRKSYGHIPTDWTTVDYNNKIKNILNSSDVEIYHYYKEYFPQSCYVYGLPKEKWIAIIGANSIMETAFIVDRAKYEDYLNVRDGYTRIK